MSWFHLYRLLLPGQELDQDRNHAQSLAAAVEQFMQSSPVGEYQSRLDLVWNFRSVQKRTCYMHVISGPLGAGTM